MQIVGFEHIIGQVKIKERLMAYIKEMSTRFFIFYGENGQGKKTIATAFARLILEIGVDKKQVDLLFDHGVHPDFKQIGWIDEKKQIPIDTIRKDILQDLILRPQIGKYKIYLIDGDQLSEQAQNALLKTFEEPDEYTVFLLTLSKEELLLKTIESRGVQLKLEKNTTLEMEQFYKTFFDECKKEYTETEDDQKIKQLQEEKIKRMLLEVANGNPGKLSAYMQSDWFLQLFDKTKEVFIKAFIGSRLEYFHLGQSLFSTYKEHFDTIILIFEWLFKEASLQSVKKQLKKQINYVAILEALYKCKESSLFNVNYDTFTFAFLIQMIRLIRNEEEICRIY